MRKFIFFVIAIACILALIGCSDVVENSISSNTDHNSTDANSQSETDITQDNNIEYPNDSFHIPQGTLRLLKESESDTVIKIYSQISSREFAERLSVDELTNNKNEIYAVFSNNGDVAIKTIKSGVVNNASEPNDYEYVIRKHLCDTALNYDRIFGVEYSDFDVLGVYCFEFGTHSGEQVIYFVTNHGDYVYYVDHNGDKMNEYLFPYEIFCQKSMEFEADKNAYQSEYPFESGGYSYNSFCDLSQYNIKNSQIDYCGFKTVDDISDSGVEQFFFFNYYFYPAVGNLYVAEIDKNNGNAINRISEYSSFEVVLEDLKSIEEGMDMFEVVARVGIPSRAPWAKRSKKLIFEANDGSYAVVDMNSDMLVESIKIRTSEELNSDLQVGMPVSSISDDVITQEYLDYIFFENDGRWCIVQCKDSVITRVKYYESFNVESRPSITVVGGDLFDCVYNYGLPFVALVDGEEVLLFEYPDGGNIAFAFDERGKAKSVQMDVEYAVIKGGG